jgi:cephalosporin-C deacetylase-like acetyl esterase
MSVKTATLSAALIMSLFMTGCTSTEKTKGTESRTPSQAEKKASAAARKPLTMPQIIGKTNKSALSYQPGEEMVFTFKMYYAYAKPGKYFLSYVRRGDDNRTFSGKVPADQTLTVKTSLDRPGFVSVNVSLVDEKGNLVKLDLSRGKNNPRAVRFLAGAGVQPEKLNDCGEPADFDAFWARQKKRLAKVPFQGKVERKLVKTFRNGKIYAVSIPAPGPRPATGYLTIPGNAKPKSLPITIFFFGYGTRPQTAPVSVVPGQIMFYLNAHGQKLGQNADYYKKFFASIRTPKYSYAFDPEQNKNPETCFFNGMVMRILRAQEYLKSLPEWDGRNLTAKGGSQGGLQTMWSAALDPDVTVALPNVTWCCDLAGTAKAKRLSGTWRIRYVPALDYYDPVFMAKRIRKADVTITRAGLGDYVCPPSGLMISYKNLATPKKTIRWVQGSDHGFVPQESEVIVWTTKKENPPVR